jgi:hypothetical protein
MKRLIPVSSLLKAQTLHSSIQAGFASRCILPPVLMRVALLVLLTTLFTGCSTSSTKRASFTAMQDLQRESIQLRVRTGNPMLDKLVYEEAYSVFGDTIPLREKGENTAVMEVLMTSQEVATYVGSTTVNANSQTTVAGDTRSYVDGWYTSSAFGVTGREQTLVTANTTSHAQAVSTGGFVTWMNGNMRVVLKRNDGKRLWNGDYRYKGGWELSGWTVKTPEEAATLILKRLHRRFLADFKE